MRVFEGLNTNEPVPKLKCENIIEVGKSKVKSLSGGAC
jgi:hypothetical protein